MDVTQLTDSTYPNTLLEHSGLEDVGGATGERVVHTNVRGMLHLLLVFHPSSIEHCLRTWEFIPVGDHGGVSVQNKVPVRVLRSERSTAERQEARGFPLCGLLVGHVLRGIELRCGRMRYNWSGGRTFYGWLDGACGVSLSPVSN